MAFSRAVSGHVVLARKGAVSRECGLAVSCLVLLLAWLVAVRLKPKLQVHKLSMAWTGAFYSLGVCVSPAPGAGQ